MLRSERCGFCGKVREGGGKKTSVETGINIHINSLNNIFYSECSGVKLNANVIVSVC